MKWILDPLSYILNPIVSNDDAHFLSCQVKDVSSHQNLNGGLNRILNFRRLDLSISAMSAYRFSPQFTLLHIFSNAILVYFPPSCQSLIILHLHIHSWLMTRVHVFCSCCSSGLILRDGRSDLGTRSYVRPCFLQDTK